MKLKQEKRPEQVDKKRNNLNNLPLFLSLSKVFTISAQNFRAQKAWARSLVRTRHRPAEPGILGSNPSGPATQIWIFCSFFAKKAS